MELTTNHPASQFGHPVLVIDGAAYRPWARVPSGAIAYYFVQEHLEELGEEMVDNFLKSFPDLYYGL